MYFGLGNPRPWALAAFVLTCGLSLASVVEGRTSTQEKKTTQTTNRLAKESSPYLLQHAHNPVDWFPWGAEAFAKAKSEKKLVFLSIGYSSCHWCHVMERESFANEGVAQLMNRSFVCIKVDREERPDIDAIYMAALNVQGSRGGWPLSMFLTADGKPIVGGTYWPPEDKELPGGTVRGFKNILLLMEKFQKDEPEKLTAQAAKLAEFTRQALARNQLGKAVADPDRSLVAGAVAALLEEYDPKWGGFGAADRDFVGTKFPVPCNFDLLLGELSRKPDEKIRAAVESSLDQMIRGGIHDHVGGGFHRYSTERTWTVPHFEKMLYDNGQLLEVYAKAYALTGKLAYRTCVLDIAGFIRDRLTSPEGVFYASLDADADGVEGKTYVWTDGEAAGALKGIENAALFQEIYGLEKPVNFEAKFHILRQEKSAEAWAKEKGTNEQQLLLQLAEPRRALKHVRDHRAQPSLDSKVLTSWNGLTIAGLALAGKYLGEPSLIERAARAADRLLADARTSSGGLSRVYMGTGKPGRLPAYLDDYTHLVHGLLSLHEATGAARWLDAAKSLTDSMVASFSDTKDGGFYYSSKDHEELFARSKDQFDGATPSGNSMAARNLVQLWRLSAEPRYRQLAEGLFKSQAAALKANPAGSVTMAAALSAFLDQGKPQPAVEAVAFAAPSQDGPTKSDSVVKISAKATPEKPGADGKQEVTVTMTIDKGWHLYANPPGQEDFITSQTVLNVEAKKPLKDVKVTYPEGKEIIDPTLGRYRVYEDKVVLKATLQRSPGDASPLELKFKFQSCNDRQCLLPASKTVTVP
jgi:uncharacterized protein YyaL (SSP411 family)